MQLPIFHLAFPVEDIARARAFYVDVLGARVGRTTDHWIDIHLFGAQITLHEQPAQVPAPDAHGVRHFGAVVAWGEWESLGRKIAESGVAFRSSPAVSYAGTPREQGKFLVTDPSGNVIELKTYRDPAAALQTEGAGR